MIWHIEYELFSAIIVMIVIFFCFKNNALPTLQNKLYRFLLVSSMVFISINLLACVAITWMDLVSIQLATFLTNLYLLFIPVLPVCLLLYIYSIIYEEIKHFPKSLWLLVIPVGISMLIVLTNFKTHWLYTLSEEGMYERSWGYIYTYINFFLCSGIGIILSLAKRKKIDRYKFIGIQSCLWIVMIPIVMQIIMPEYIFTGAACALAALVTYFSMQSRSGSVDELTGAFNRPSFIKMIDMHLRNNHPMSVIVMALDDFKFINQTFGIKNGDALLQRVTCYLSQVSVSGRVYRIGGDRFALIVHHYTEDQIKRITKRIMSRFENKWTLGTVECILSTSMSVIEAPKQAKTKEEILASIDFTIREAKKRTPKEVVYADHKVAEKMERVHDIKNALKVAIEKDLFEVYYQPIYSNEKERFSSAEALIRYKDDKLGFISPGEFIPIAEQTGLIVPIGLMVFEKVCQFITKSDYLKQGYMSMSVNLSVVQCMQENLADDLLKIMKKYKVNPEVFSFEITETVLASSFEQIQQLMIKLSQKGARFALDDFGTGYSGVSYMLQLPFNTIKLDKSLIDSLASDAKRQVAIEGVMAMTKKMQMATVAEGVEEGKQAQLLKQMGCTYLQGYYYSRPIAQQDFYKLIEENKAFIG